MTILSQNYLYQIIYCVLWFKNSAFFFIVITAANYAKVDRIGSCDFQHVLLFKISAIFTVLSLNINNLKSAKKKKKKKTQKKKKNKIKKKKNKKKKKTHTQKKEINTTTTHMFSSKFSKNPVYYRNCIDLTYFWPLNTFMVKMWNKAQKQKR